MHWCVAGRCPVRTQGSKVRFADNTEKLTCFRVALTIFGALADPNLLGFPLALLQEMKYYSCRSKRGAIENSTYRSAAGHIRSAYSENFVAGDATWVGDLRARSTDVERCSQNPTGLVVSGSASLERRGWIKASWGISENNRRAKYYELTRSGQKQLEVETDSWRKLTAAITQILESV